MRHVQWSESALRDFEEALSFLAVRDHGSASLIADRIDSAAARLGEIPTGRPGRVDGTYEKSVDKTSYILAYALSDDAVTIVRVIHDRRRWLEGEWPE